MCGISGYFSYSGLITETLSLTKMNHRLAHRGPDGEGYVFIHRQSGHATAFRGELLPLTRRDLPTLEDQTAGPHDIAFGHRRFAIVDLSEGGHQPLVDTRTGSDCILNFQGEIYNYVELRAELEKLGHVFQTHSDSEVLLHAYLEWKEDCFPRLEGFWALAIWDGRRKGLLLARDRMGKAPLYLARQAGRLWWSSEIKGIRAGVGSDTFAVNLPAAHQFVRLGLRDFHNQTFFQGIDTFPRASYAWIDEEGEFQPRSYWDIPKTRLTAKQLDARQAGEELDRRLKAAVTLRLRADVPVGLELSGGLDSSVLAAYSAQGRAGKRPLETFTVSFPGTAWDEAGFAQSVANRYPEALNLKILVPDHVDILNRLPDFQARMDEPFHSPNMIINQDIWKRMSALGIKVSLNGAAGDELFAGYGTEYFGPYLRHLLGDGRFAMAWKEFSQYSEADAGDFRSRLRSVWMLLPYSWRRNLRSLNPPPALDPFQGSALPTPLPADDIESLILDYLTDYKMNYWLRSGHTSTMQVPVEVRLPFLDTGVVEWAGQMPIEYLIRDGWLKWVLRKTAEPLLPSEVVWRKLKMGFPFPLREWLQSGKGYFLALQTEDMPDWIDARLLFTHYEALADKYPNYLWRCLSTLLWWKHCLGRSYR